MDTTETISRETTVEDGKKLYINDLPQGLHLNAKKAALNEGITLRQFAINALEAAIESHQSSNRR